MLDGLSLKANDTTITTFDAAPAADSYKLVLATVATETEPAKTLVTGQLVTVSA